MEIFDQAIRLGASDIHLTENNKPCFRINRELIETGECLTHDDIESIICSITNELQRDKFREIGEFDFSYNLNPTTRFRINLYKERSAPALAIRILPREIMSLDQLGYPDDIKQLTRHFKGLILVTGPTGSGKSMTQAAMINQINIERSCHILTLEDPIEFLHSNKKSIIHQREIYADSKSFSSGIKAALREDPNVLLIGEMRDPETIATAITAAETGILVLATLHTVDAAQTIDRIIDAFPATQQQQIRMQLSLLLQGVVSQHLFARSGGDGLVAAFEILKMNAGIRNLIRTGKTEHIKSSMEDGNMLTMEKSIKKLYMQGNIDRSICDAFLHDKGAIS
jgi:twitching motility protein PilT